MKKHFCSSLKYMSIFELTQTSPKPQLVSKSSCTSGLMQQNFRLLNQGQSRCSGLGPGPGLGSGSVYLPVCLFVCVFFLPFSTGMFQLISLTINLFFWNDQYWNFHSIPKRPWLGPYIIWFLLFFPLWIENESPKRHIDEEFKAACDDLKGFF